MSDTALNPDPKVETDPPEKKSSKGAIIGGIVIFFILWVVFGAMRKPGAVTKIHALTVDDQRPLVLRDGQSEAGLGVQGDLSEAIKEGIKAEPIEMGKKDVWYTFYPPMDVDEEIKKEVKAGNGWTLINESEERYSWKGKYEVKLRAPATSDIVVTGVMFFERNLGIGDQILLTLKNMLP